jgi:hypothetical protein
MASAKGEKLIELRAGALYRVVAVCRGRRVKWEKLLTCDCITGVMKLNEPNSSHVVAEKHTGWCFNAGWCFTGAQANMYDVLDIHRVLQKNRVGLGYNRVMRHRLCQTSCE